MAQATVSIGQKYCLPPFSEDADFDQWCFEVDMWKLVTDLKPEKQGPMVFLSLSPKIRQACSALSKDELKKDDGLDKLITKLRELYGVSNEQATFSAYEKFETFQRSEGININDYINEFEQLNQKLVTYKIELPLAVHAYQLLKNANLPKEKRDLARATVLDLTYESMKKQIKAIYDQCSASENKKVESSGDEIQVESEVFYGQGRGPWRRGPFRGNTRSRGVNVRNRNTGGSFSPNQAGRFVPREGNRNPIGRDGRPTQCHSCGSIYHWLPQCPNSSENKKPVSKEVHISYLTEQVEQCFLEQEVSETLNCAVVDSGCTSNVVGINWLHCYLDTFPSNITLQERQSGKTFRFGPSKSYPSLKQVIIPANIDDIEVEIVVDVVDCEIPLLLSKQFMKDADSTLDFVSDCITMYGKRVALMHTSGGHYCIPISSKPAAIMQPSIKVYLTIDHLDKKTIKKKHEIATKLHKQFGHPVDSIKLKQLLKNANITDKELDAQIDSVTDNCDTCDRYRKVRSRPVVSLPLAHAFNDCLALDLKFLNIRYRQYTVLHMIDIFSRFSQATLIPSKHKDMIVQAILKNWVSIFGVPQSIFSDNGGEFDNHLLRDVAELLGTRVITTAAYSPWSNGIVERHNAVLENMILKLIDDSKCSVANALVWAVTAKNALHNNLGYSPNQLVFGKNNNLPSVLTAKPPALHSCTHSQLLAEHLNALHAARTAFIASEASRKIKLALQKQTRDTSSKSFHLGAQVYYKRNDGKAWHGPGIIAGIDGKIVLVRHGGSMLRVSPVHLLPVRDAEKQRAKDTLSHMGQDGLPQSGKVSENLSCDKGAQTDVLVTIDDVINDEDSDRHIPKDPLSGTGSAHNGISSNSVAPSAHDEMCATESEICYGDAPSHIVIWMRVNMSSPK